MSRKLTLDFSSPSPRKPSDRPGTVPLTAARNNAKNILLQQQQQQPQQPQFIPDPGTVVPGPISSSHSNHLIECSNSRGVSFRIPNSNSANAISSQDAAKASVWRSSSAASTADAPTRNHCRSDAELRSAAEPKTTNPNSKIERIKSKSMDEIGVLKTSSNEVYDFGVKDLKDMGQIGAGSFGTVNKMLHITSQSMMAVKRIRVSVNEADQRQVVMDLGVIRKASYKHIVTFHGALFHEGECWICMELMDLSAELLYRYVHHSLGDSIPEQILAQIALATVQALKYLRDHLAIIHRDVKPSNMLVNRQGSIKLCDFGISGVLIDSIARTHDVGCRPYMAPERIDPRFEKDGYDIRSDVWSMGISLIEISTGSFPYKAWNNVFEQLQEVVTGQPPKLKDMPSKINFSPQYHHFIESCLKKERKERPKYSALLKSAFLLRAAQDHSVDIADWVEMILKKTEEVPLPVNK